MKNAVIEQQNWAAFIPPLWTFKHVDIRGDVSSIVDFDLVLFSHVMVDLKCNADWWKKLTSSTQRVLIMDRFINWNDKPKIPFKSIQEGDKYLLWTKESTDS